MKIRKSSLYQGDMYTFKTVILKKVTMGSDKALNHRCYNGFLFSGFLFNILPKY